MTEHHRNKWLILAVVGAAFFMTILDVAIVNVAIPSIQKDLNIAESTVQWVITAYAITFGGFLLLGGRMSDLLGRRRIFIVGLILFTLASLACGLAQSAGMLIASRAVQGLGAAIISPAALSIVTTTFAEGADRNKALGIWGALGGSGAAVGVLLGGILTEYLGWEWIFFVNVPVGALVLALTPRIVPESRADLGHRPLRRGRRRQRHRRPRAARLRDLEGARRRLGTGRTIGLLIASLAILAFFVIWELRTEAPLVPFGIFRIRTLTGANVVGFLLGASIFANFFVLTLYVQQVLGWSALKTGVTFLATAGTTVIWAGVAQALVTKVGPRWVTTVGMTVLALTMLGYTRLPVDGSYWPDLLPLLSRSSRSASRSGSSRSRSPRSSASARTGRARIGTAEHEPADRRRVRRRRSRRRSSSRRRSRVTSRRRRSRRATTGRSPRSSRSPPPARSSRSSSSAAHMCAGKAEEGPIAGSS